MQRSPQKGSETQEVVRLRGLYAILTKIGACALRDAQLCGSDLEIYNGKPFSKGCLCTHLTVSSSHKSLFPGWESGDTFAREIYALLLGG